MAKVSVENVFVDLFIAKKKRNESIAMRYVPDTRTTYQSIKI